MQFQAACYFLLLSASGAFAPILSWTPQHQLLLLRARVRGRVPHASQHPANRNRNQNQNQNGMHWRIGIQSGSHSWQRPSSMDDLSEKESDDDADEDLVLLTDRTSSSNLESHPLTSIERERRLSELELLSQLYNNDDAIPKLKELWFSERGSELQALLTQADLMIGNPTTWPQSEDLLLSLIQTDQTFLEPKVRLSKLYCLQGRLDESSKLSTQVLAQKPWHFVALVTMVAVSAAQGNADGLQLWQARELPKPSRKEERTLWVDRAIGDAAVLLTRAERMHQTFLGQLDSDPSSRDDSNRDPNRNEQALGFDNGEWQ